MMLGAASGWSLKRGSAIANSRDGVPSSTHAGWQTLIPHRQQYETGGLSIRQGVVVLRVAADEGEGGLS